MVERPALVRVGGGWRLYVCCATPNSKHWWIGLVAAKTLEGLADADVRPIFPGDETVGVKDPVIQCRDGRWHAWICCHPLDVEGEEDRMTTGYATSSDGLDWDWHGTVLAGRPGMWDPAGHASRPSFPAGKRRTTAGHAGGEWFERIGVAEANGDGSFSRPARLSSTRDTSKSLPSEAVGTVSTTRPGFLTRATSCERRLSITGR